MKPETLKKYHIKTYDDVYRLVDNRMRTASIPPLPRTRSSLAILKNTLLVKLGVAYNIVDAELSRIIEVLTVIEKMHPFYKEIFVLETGKTPTDLIKRFKALKRKLSQIYNEYRQGIKTGLTGGEATRSFKAGLGRILSIYKRNSKIILKIKETVKELSELPDVTGELSVIIAGMPQVGKSTLLSKLTRAKPEISPFPFTTKTIIAGHINADPYGKIVLIDTPGLLDRPIDKKNPIEMKAVMALKHLAEIILYLFDGNPSGYYSLEQQLRVYRSIEENFPKAPKIIAINKIDITTQEEIEKIKEKIKLETGIEPLLISAKTGAGLENIKNILLEKLMEKVQLLSQ